MPRFDQMDTVSQVITAGGSHLQFSAVRPDKLKSALVSLTTVVIDKSGSVAPFASLLRKMVISIAEGCKSRPDMLDSVVFRLTAFNNRVDEIQGFAQFHTLDINSYPEFRPNGGTALYRAILDAIAATSEYARQVSNSGRQCNASIFVVTDGQENSSNPAGTITPVTTQSIVEAMRTLRGEETTESALTFLVGLDQGGSQYLQDLTVDAHFDQYVDANSLDIGQLGDWIYRSIEAQSSVVGSGQASTIIPYKP